MLKTCQSCLLLVCGFAVSLPACARPCHAAIGTCPATVQSCNQRGCALDLGLRWCRAGRVFCTIPRQEVPGAWEKVVGGPDLEARSCLGCSSQVSPSDCPVGHSLPGGPSTLLLLTHRCTLVPFLFHPGNFRDNQIFCLLLGGFGPSLWRSSPS